MWPATFTLKYSLSKKWWTVANKNIIIIIIDIIFILQVENTPYTPMNEGCNPKIKFTGR